MGPITQSLASRQLPAAGSRKDPAERELEGLQDREGLGAPLLPRVGATGKTPRHKDQHWLTASKETQSYKGRTTLCALQNLEMVNGCRCGRKLTWPDSECLPWG